MIDIYIPNDDDEEEGDEGDMDLAARAVVQFSTKSETLSWCALLPRQMLSTTRDMRLSNFDHTSRTIVCSSLATRPIMTLHCKKGGKMKFTLHEGDCFPPPPGEVG